MSATLSRCALSQDGPSRHRLPMCIESLRLVLLRREAVWPHVDGASIPRAMFDPPFKFQLKFRRRHWRRHYEYHLSIASDTLNFQTKLGERLVDYS